LTRECGLIDILEAGTLVVRISRKHESPNRLRKAASRRERLSFEIFHGERKTSPSEQDRATTRELGS
jgi:hypothetical protein